jgi:hypothetical protein
VASSHRTTVAGEGAAAEKAQDTVKKETIRLNRSLGMIRKQYT